MGDIKFDCPLCCNKTYDTKQDLIDHLDQALGNLYCPICKNKWASLANLIEHLSLDNCTPDNTVHTVLLHDTTHNNIIENSLENSNSNDQTTENENSNENFSKCDLSVGEFETATDANDSKMYVELLGRQLMKPCLQTQELKLVKENGESRYLIVTQEDGDLSVGTVVTKQNNDGTISLTTVKDMKIESDTMIENMDNEQEDNQDEIYSCNTCGVSFSSVIDHIQNYHNDQEVVVEEPIEDDSISIEYDSHENVDTTPTEKQISRRMITDTGNIVEEPLIEKTSSVIEQRTLVINDEPKKEVVDKQGKLFVRRYVQIDKMCDSVVKDIKETEDEKGGPYHKVVVKEVLTPSGSNVKMYHCMSCNIFVSTLAEFKTHPCKTLKYPCPHCPIAYENSKSLCAHMKVHKIKSDEYSPAQIQPLQTTYECELCNTVFPSNKSLKLHKRMHDPVKARPMEGPVESTENTDVRYMCNICNKMILLDYKTIHQNSHKTSDKMNCSICNRKFTSKEYLDMHMNVHNVDKVPLNKQDKSLPYSCLYCSRRFARPHEKVKHERIHTGEKPHSCDICGKSFRVSYCLTLHMRTHTGARPYACQHCGKRFKAHSVYNHHLLTHSEVRAYKCPYCPKAFKTSVQLAGHKNSHTKPFSCQHCNRPFASLYAVRVHTETHARQNNLKFSCSLCGASYARAFALKDHVKQVHKQEIDNVDHLDTSKTNVKEDWMIKLGADTEDINTPSKDLPAEITQLDEHNDELIVPN